MIKLLTILKIRRSMTGILLTSQFNLGFSYEEFSTVQREGDGHASVSIKLGPTKPLRRKSIKLLLWAQFNFYVWFRRIIFFDDSIFDLLTNFCPPTPAALRANCKDWPDPSLLSQQPNFYLKEEEQEMLQASSCKIKSHKNKVACTCKKGSPKSIQHGIIKSLKF